MMEAEKGLHTEEALQPKEAEKGLQKEEALHQVQAEQGQEKEEAFHQMEAAKGLQTEETLALHGIKAEQRLQMEQTLHPMQEEQEALHGIEAEQELQMEVILHQMESEMGIRMEDTLIHLLEAVVAEKRAKTSRLREEWAEMEAAVEAKGNELEFLKINRDRCFAEQLLLQDADQLLRDILFPPN